MRHLAKASKPMSLFAELLEHGRSSPGVPVTDVPQAGFSEEILKPAKAAQCFDVTNVASYLFESSSKESWRLERDFPNLAPPFPNCWLEWRTPRFSNSEGKIIEFPREHRLMRWAALVVAHDFYAEMPPGIEEHLKEVKLEKIDEEFERLKQEVGDKITTFDGHLRQQFLWSLAVLAKGARWFISVYPFSGGVLSGGRCLGPSVKLQFAVGPQGEHVRGPQDLALTGGAYTQEAHKSIQQEKSLPTQLVFPAFLALSFMHCRNVKLVPERTARSKKAAKRGDPVIDYRTLAISPMKEVLRQASSGHKSGDNTLQTALHICRGHFKTYTEERPLLGKHTGTFWWKDSVRGTTSRGLIAKSYSVKGKP